MKKIYSLAILLSISILHADAKTNGVSVSGVYPHFNSNGQAISTSSGNSRLVAKSHFVYNGSGFVAIDSFNYTYTTNHGGSPDIRDANDDNVFFDESMSYFFYNGAPFVLQKRVQTYYSNNNIKSLKPQPYNIANNTWKDTIMYNYNYNSDNLVTNMQMNVWLGQGINQVTFNNNYILQNGVELLNTLNSPLHTLTFSYDQGNNDLITSVDTKKNVNNDTIAQTRDNFAYDGAGRLTEKKSEEEDLATSIYHYTESWTYTYNGAATNPQTGLKKIWVNNAWQISELHTYTYDANDNLMLDLNQAPTSSNGYVNTSKTEWTYNVSNQPLTIVSHTWNVSSGSWMIAANDYQRKFYYETYIPTSVANLDKTAMHLNLYPNPATDNVNLSMQWDTPQPFTVMIYDIQGRVMQQWQESPTRDYNKQIALSNLVSGTYVVKIVSEKGAQASMILPVHR